MRLGNVVRNPCEPALKEGRAGGTGKVGVGAGDACDMPRCWGREWWEEGAAAAAAVAVRDGPALAAGLKAAAGTRMLPLFPATQPHIAQSCSCCLHLKMQEVWALYIGALRLVHMSGVPKQASYMLRLESLGPKSNGSCESATQDSYGMLSNATQ
jgi:hypothetical protein